MEFYQIALLLTVVYGIWWFVRWLNKPVSRSFPKPDPTTISGYTSGRTGIYPSEPTSCSRINEANDLKLALALSLVTNQSHGRNVLVMGMLGALMHDSINGNRESSQSTGTSVHDDRNSHDVDESPSLPDVGNSNDIGSSDN